MDFKLFHPLIYQNYVDSCILSGFSFKKQFWLVTLKLIQALNLNLIKISQYVIVV